jgi:hypothetical protein
VLSAGLVLKRLSQNSKSSTKISSDRVLYRKILIPFRKISNCGTSSLMRGGVDGAS